MTLFNDIMPYFAEFIHVYDWNMSILWSPLKIWTPQNFTTANFRHPLSKSWLKHCLGLWVRRCFLLDTPVSSTSYNCSRNMAEKVTKVKIYSKLSFWRRRETASSRVAIWLMFSRYDNHAASNLRSVALAWEWRTIAGHLLYWLYAFLLNYPACTLLVHQNIDTVVTCVSWKIRGKSLPTLVLSLIFHL